MRGRLIFPMLIELGLLDTDSTAAIDPDGDGPKTSGYDDDFREPVIVAPVEEDSSERGTIARIDRVVELYAQVEDANADVLNMAASGNNPRSMIGLVFHFKDLEDAGAVQAGTGKPIIKAPGARLLAIRNPRTGDVIERFDSAPGFYAIEARSMGFGMGADRNLLLVIFEERDVSVPATGG